MLPDAARARRRCPRPAAQARRWGVRSNRRATAIGALLWIRAQLSPRLWLRRPRAVLCSLLKQRRPRNRSHKTYTSPSRRPVEAAPSWHPNSRPMTGMITGGRRDEPTNGPGTSRRADGWTSIPADERLTGGRTTRDSGRLDERHSTARSEAPPRTPIAEVAPAHGPREGWHWEPRESLTGGAGNHRTDSRPTVRSRERPRARVTDGIVLVRSKPFEVGAVHPEPRWAQGRRSLRWRRRDRSRHGSQGADEAHRARTERAEETLGRGARTRRACAPQSASGAPSAIVSGSSRVSHGRTLRRRLVQMLQSDELSRWSRWRLSQPSGPL